MPRRTAIAALLTAITLGAVSEADADTLLAWWSFNNSSNSDQGDGLYAAGANDFYFPVTLNEQFDDGFWTGPTDGFVDSGVQGDLMYPVYDRFSGSPGALIPAGADDFDGDTVSDTAAFLAAFGNDFGAVLNVGGLVGNNDGNMDEGDDWGSLGGTSLNRPTGTFSGGSLAIQGDANNGSSFQIEADLSGWRDIEVSWAQRGTGTGFDSRDVSVSTDGVNFTSIFSETGTLGSSFELRTALVGSLLDGASTAYIRFTVDGASSDFGNNRFDNIQLTGTVIPEPSSILLMGLGVVGLAGAAIRRRRQAA